MIRVTLTGGKGLRRRLGRLSMEQRRALTDAIKESAEALRDELKADLGVRAGRPSAPGEPPAMDSGRLRDSVFAETDADGLSARVGSDLDYAAHLEFGTTRMAARPWLLPAFERMKPRIVARLAAAARAGLRKGARF